MVDPRAVSEGNPEALTRRGVLTTGSIAGGGAVAGCLGESARERPDRPAQQESGPAVAYRIRKTDDRTVQALNRSTGAVDFEGERPIPVAQSAYDALAEREQEGRGLINSSGTQRGTLTFAPDTYRYGQALRHYGSRIHVSAPGALFRPREGYEGYLIRMRTTSETARNREGPAEGPALQDFFIEGERRAKGIYVNTVDRAHVGGINVVDTNGPGMHLAGGREFSVDGLYMKHCGSETDPALLVSPDGEMQGDALNGIRFYGLVSSYPTDRNVVIETDTSVKSNQTRQIDFFGAQLHENEPADEGSGNYPEGHGAGRNVAVRGVRGVRFWGCNLRNSKPDTAVVTFSQAPSGEFNGGIRFVGCSFSASQSGVAGVVFRYLRGDDPPVLLGNGFGTYAPLDHAVDWAGGDTYDVYASGNVFEPTKHPFRGHVPHNRERPGIGRIDELHTGYYDDWADGKATRRSRTSVQLQTVHRPKVVPACHEWAGGEVGDGHLAIPPNGQADIDAWMSTAYGGWELTGSFDATPQSGHLQWNVMQGSPSNGYALRLGADGRLALVKRVEGEATTLIEGSWPADDAEHTVLLTREHAANEFVLRLDGATVGTAEDEWTPLPAKRGFVGFRNRSDQRFRATELAVGTARRSRSSTRSIPNRTVDVGGGLDDLGDVSPVSFTAGPSVGDVSTGGRAWLTWDEDALYLSARIEDDTHAQPETGGGIWKGDSMQIGVGRGRPGTYERFHEFAVALTEEGEQVFLYEQPGGEAAGLLSSPDVSIERDDGAGVTTYEVALPWSVLPITADADVAGLSLVVNDNDGQGRTGWAQWGGGIAAGKDTSQFRAVRFSEG